MLNVLALVRLLPVTASMAIHAAIVGVLCLVPAWTASRERVIVLDLIEPETPPASAAAPVKPDPRPLTLPRPIRTPLPVEPPRVVEPPRPVEPPRSVEPAPPQLPKDEVAASAAPAPTAPITSAPSQTPNATSPASATSDSSAVSDRGTAASSPGTTIASTPPDGVTQRAMPRGGYQHRPSYPPSARRLGIQGTTLLGVLVSDDGRVAEVVVKQSAGHPDLDSAAAEAVRRWRFEPARRGGEAVAMWVLLPVEFKLR